MEDPEDPKEKSNNFCFTFNNWQDHEECLARMHNFDFHDNVKYVAFSYEIAPTTGTPHLQGVVHLWEPRELQWVIKEFPAGIKWFVMRGRFTQAKDYCGKDDNQIFEFGQHPTQGRRKDIIDLKRRMDAGENYMDVAIDEEQHMATAAKYYRFFDKYQSYKRQKTLSTNRDVPTVYIRVGFAGTGKTKWMDERFGAGNWKTAPDNTGRWFDGCDRDVILFDDVSSREIVPVDLFKRICDRYPLELQCKGGFITWKPKVIVFTSNEHWNSWWKDLSDADIAAVKRRITEVFIVN